MVRLFSFHIRVLFIIVDHMFPGSQFVSVIIIKSVKLFQLSFIFQFICTVITSWLDNRHASFSPVIAIFF